jgi:hypothetical protein
MNPFAFPMLPGTPSSVLCAQQDAGFLHERARQRRLPALITDQSCPSPRALLVPGPRFSAGIGEARECHRQNGVSGRLAPRQIETLRGSPRRLLRARPAAPARADGSATPASLPEQKPCRRRGDTRLATSTQHIRALAFASAPHRIGDPARGLRGLQGQLAFGPSGATPKAGGSPVARRAPSRRSLPASRRREYGAPQQRGNSMFPPRQAESQQNLSARCFNASYG